MRDEHCHIIWGVDDGSESKAESLQMLDAAHKAGITQIVATPHARWDSFSVECVEERFAELASEAAARGMQMTLGYEVYYKTMLSRGLEWASKLTMTGTTNLLIEFNSGGEVPHGWDQTFYRLQSEYGLDITLAHPERYGSVLDDFDLVYRIKEMGCRIQVSAGDAFGGMFNKQSKCVKRMLKEGLVDAIVSDAHCPEHYADFAKLVAKWQVS